MDDEEHSDGAVDILGTEGRRDGLAAHAAALRAAVTSMGEHDLRALPSLAQRLRDRAHVLEARLAQLDGPEPREKARGSAADRD